MSDNHIFYAGICQHVRGDLACVRALLLEIHILSANLDICSLACLYDRNDVDSRYAEYNVRFLRLNERL